MTDFWDTIAAIASARGEASVGIVRISGASARKIAEAVFRRPSGRPVKTWCSRRSVLYGLAVHPKDGRELDEVLLLWMPGPRSYTGEDVVEFQVHGGSRVLEGVLEAILVAGCRLAEPGEFTKRAFLNGRMDLSQAEGVMDLIRAKTDLASQAALRQVRGGLRENVVGLRRRLLRLEAHVEVTIDYPEHEVEDEARDLVVKECEALGREVTQIVDSSHLGQILRDGIGTAILGRPNVGKSSLMNRLLRRERAIVTEIPGTTRDVLEEYVSIEGIPFRIIDTAGIRDTEDVVEQIGVERSREVMEDAEVVILIMNAGEPLGPEDEELLRATRAKPRLVLLNKVDLGIHVDVKELESALGGDSWIAVSLKTGEGVDAFLSELVRIAVGEEHPMLESSFATNARQTNYLREALEDLNLARFAALEGATLDIIAVQLQSAYAALGQVIGEEVGEDLLDEIFSQFCLGK